MFSSAAYAQVDPPDRKFLFSEDKTKKKEERARKLEIRKRQKQIAKQARAKGYPVDINATTTNYDAATNTLEGSGGVVIGYSTSVIEAEEGTVGMESKQAKLSGDVRITDTSGNVSADEVEINLETGTGKLKNADIYFEEGNYRVVSKEADKIGDETYELHDTVLTTCKCPEGDSCLPWELSANRAKITKDGYGQVWGAFLETCGVPVFYTPYLFFPAKSERQTGFLPPNLGYGRESGFSIQTPFFIAIDKQTDATISPLYEAKARYGVETEFRHLFARRSPLEMGFTYLNESAREGDLQGTNVFGLDDPKVDENRIAGYVDHQSSAEWLGKERLQLVLDGAYVSDDLFLREFGDDNIGDYNSRFVTSRGVLRSSLFTNYSVELASEYTQDLVENDDFVFQRLPELAFLGFNSYKPFGENLLGARLVILDDLSLVNFNRVEGYDGTRAELYEKAKMPFHFRNYFEGELGADVRASQYSLGEDEIPGSGAGGEPDELPSSSDRVVPGFNAGLATTFEKVFAVSSANPLKYLAELGQVGRQGELVRLKHTIEPIIRYRYVPEVDQDENPQFDSRDHLARRNVVTYELYQGFTGRFEGRNEYLYGVEETTPEITDLRPLQDDSPIDPRFDSTRSSDAASDFRSMSSGSRRELAAMRIYQSMDVNEVRGSDEDEDGIDDDDAEKFSDVGVDLKLSPNEYFGVTSKLNLDHQSGNFTSYSLGAQLNDKRGDEIRSRITFVDADDEPLRQLEASAEIRLTERLGLGFYGRYNDVTAELLEGKVGLRLKSNCKCWIMDFDLHDRINPDETRATVNLTLVGLGEFGNTFMTEDRRNLDR